MCWYEAPRSFPLNVPKPSRIRRLWIMMLPPVNHSVKGKSVRSQGNRGRNIYLPLMIVMVGGHSLWIPSLFPSFPVLCQVLRQERNPSRILRWSHQEGHNTTHCQFGNLFFHGCIMGYYSIIVIFLTVVWFFSLNLEKHAALCPTPSLWSCSIPNWLSRG